MRHKYSGDPLAAPLELGGRSWLHHQPRAVPLVPPASLAALSWPGSVRTTRLQQSSPQASFSQPRALLRAVVLALTAALSPSFKTADVGPMGAAAERV